MKCKRSVHSATISGRIIQNPMTFTDAIAEDHRRRRGGAAQIQDESRFGSCDVHSGYAKWADASSGIMPGGFH
jgi:hypothetical protein